MRPAETTRVLRREQRHAWRGIPSGRRRTHQVVTEYGRGQRERDRRASWAAATRTANTEGTQMDTMTTGTDTGTADFTARYTVRGQEGVAWRLLGYAQECTEGGFQLDCDGTCDTSDGDHTDACYLYAEPELTENRDRVRAVMVGDDRVELIDVADLTVISSADYCSSCGQTGCQWDARDE